MREYINDEALEVGQKIDYNKKRQKNYYNAWQVCGSILSLSSFGGVIYLFMVLTDSLWKGIPLGFIVGLVFIRLVDHNLKADCTVLAHELKEGVKTNFFRYILPSLLLLVTTGSSFFFMFIIKKANVASIDVVEIQNETIESKELDLKLFEAVSKSESEKEAIRLSKLTEVTEKHDKLIEAAIQNYKYGDHYSLFLKSTKPNDWFWTENDRKYSSMITYREGITSARKAKQAELSLYMPVSSGQSGSQMIASKVATDSTFNTLLKSATTGVNQFNSYLDAIVTSLGATMIFIGILYIVFFALFVNHRNKKAIYVNIDNDGWIDTWFNIMGSISKRPLLVVQEVAVNTSKATKGKEIAFEGFKAQAALDLSVKAEEVLEIRQKHKDAIDKNRQIIKELDNIDQSDSKYKDKPIHRFEEMEVVEEFNPTPIEKDGLWVIEWNKNYRHFKWFRQQESNYSGKVKKNPSNTHAEQVRLKLEKCRDLLYAKENVNIPRSDSA